MLIGALTRAADHLERELLEGDRTLVDLAAGIDAEAEYAERWCLAPTARSSGGQPVAVR